MPGQHFVAATQLTSHFASGDWEPIDGVLGLGFPRLHHLDGSPFVQTAFNQHLITEQSFDIHMPSEDIMELYLGGARDQNLYNKEKVDQHVVDDSRGLWELQGASVLVGETVAVSGLHTVLDTGGLGFMASSAMARSTPLSHLASNNALFADKFVLLQISRCRNLHRLGRSHYQSWVPVLHHSL